MSESDEKGLETLIVWKKAIQFAKYICKIIVAKFPEQEKYALASQIRRSAQSIPANIAEGYGRFYYQEGIRFAYIARGSLEETHSHLTYACEMDYISSTEYDDLKKRIGEVRKLIDGYINYLKRTKRGRSEPGAHYYISSNSDFVPDLDIADK
jgi:four helix bundle protein